jgi:hypothetical protein
LSSICLKGKNISAQGNAWESRAIMIGEALKGRDYLPRDARNAEVFVDELNDIAWQYGIALSGLCIDVMVRNPGRCPGLLRFSPSAFARFLLRCRSGHASTATEL